MKLLTFLLTTLSAMSVLTKVLNVVADEMNRMSQVGTLGS